MAIRSSAPSCLLGCSRWPCYPETDSHKVNLHIFIFKCITLAIHQALQVSQTDRAAFTMAGWKKSWTGSFFLKHCRRAYLASARNNSSVWSPPPQQYTNGHARTHTYTQRIHKFNIARCLVVWKGSRLPKRIRLTKSDRRVYASDVMIDFSNKIQIYTYRN